MIIGMLTSVKKNQILQKVFKKDSPYNDYSEKLRTRKVNVILGTTTEFNYYFCIDIKMAKLILAWQQALLRSGKGEVDGQRKGGK